jgi:hypothetical protein
MTAVASGFRPVHAWDRSFFLAFVAVCWLGVLMGFAPAVGARLQGRADYAAPLILHLHAAAYVGWLFLLTGQTVLISTRRVALHRKMGLIGVGLIPVMVISIYPIFYTVAFGVLASAALLLRRDSAAHKRLILLATTAIVGAAYARWFGEDLAALAGDGIWGKTVENFTGANVILLLAMIYDQVTRGRVHAVYLIAAPALVLAQLLSSYIYHLDGWPALVRQMVGL